MPPKEKVSKVNVQEKAFEMTREYGFKEVTARKLAEQLNCSTQPIFRAYENMDELRTELFYMSTEFFCEYLIAKRRRNKHIYMSLAISYIELARQEKHLFELIAAVDDFGCQTINEFLKREDWVDVLSKLPGMEDKTTKEREDLFMMLWMFVHGLTSLVVSERVSLADKEIKNLLMKAYDGFLTQI